MVRLAYQAYIKNIQKARELIRNEMKEETEYLTPEPATCSRFGCGKTITREESLFGGLCINCQGVKRVDIMAVLKFE